MRSFQRVSVIFLLVALLFVAYRAGPRLSGLEERVRCLITACPTPLALPLPTAPPAPSPLPSPTPLPSLVPPATPPPEIIVVPYGSDVQEGRIVATPTPRPRFVREEVLRERYGSTGYPSVEAMPEELRYYVLSTVQEVADFFALRPEELLALLQAQNGGQLRLQREPEPDATVLGVAGLSPREWSGWAAPDHAGYLADLRAIEQFGGVGFEWSARFAWRSWSGNRASSGAQISTRATPDRFDNNVAALARFLLRYGLTAEAATREPARFAERLAAAMADLQHAHSLPKALAAPQEADTVPVAPADAAGLRVAFSEAMDRAFAVRLSEEDLVALVDSSPVAAAFVNGEVSAADGAARLLDQTRARYLDEGRAARAAGLPLPWPFATSESELAAQQLVVAHLGHTLAGWEIQLALVAAGGDLPALETDLAARGDAALFGEARQRLEEDLQRRVWAYEVGGVVQEVLAPYNQRWLGSWDSRRVEADLEYVIRRLPEFRALHGDLFFAATPLDPMPSRVLQPFGVPASYQPEGYHTGLDLRGDRVGGKQPALYAMAAGTVVHVGPLYCLREGACRGPYAIVIHHGNQVYSVYSHNSMATVQAGDPVEAGQMIGRQGNEGYSRGPHLHLEIHAGSPYSGDWQSPWYGGDFVDPWPWLPRAGEP